MIWLGLGLGRWSWDHCLQQHIQLVSQFSHLLLRRFGLVSHLLLRRFGLVSHLLLRRFGLVSHRLKLPSVTLLCLGELVSQHFDICLMIRSKNR
jgi:hypothetical protein